MKPTSPKSSRKGSGLSGFPGMCISIGGSDIRAMSREDAADLPLAMVRMALLTSTLKEKRSEAKDLRAKQKGGTSPALLAVKAEIATLQQQVSALKQRYPGLA